MFRKISIVIVILISCGFLYAQKPSDFAERTDINMAMAPFLHGVASGDPLQDRVILWTRLTLPAALPAAEVHWEIASDTSFRNVVNQGSVRTGPEKDYTVKADATGLQPDQWYYYRFRYNNAYSCTGRTRTFPEEGLKRIRAAVLSCQDYQNGFYNALQHLAQRNDFDVVFHLGDYIYEYAANSAVGREHEPMTEMIQLSDYRIRHSQYRLDRDLRNLHQQYPFICVWDDHETANDSWREGAHNHDPKTEGDFADRKRNSTQAYAEWMPIRLPESDNNLHIYRSFRWGQLAEFYFLDTRLIDRDEQAGGLFLSVSDSTLNDSSRVMLGRTQMQWLQQQMSQSKAQWQVLAQQVMMAPLLFRLFNTWRVINPDQWDGYPAERERLLKFIHDRKIQNLVVLTGDIHTSWANNIPYKEHRSADGSEAPIGVEFVGTSVTSASGLNLPGVISEVRFMNPHIQFADLEHHGYFILDIEAARTHADWYFVNKIDRRKYKAYHARGFETYNGESRLREAPEAKATEQNPALPPSEPAEKGPENGLWLLSTAKEKETGMPVIQYYTSKPGIFDFYACNAQGDPLYQTAVAAHKGLNYCHFKDMKSPGTLDKVRCVNRKSKQEASILVR